MVNIKRQLLLEFCKANEITPTLQETDVEFINPIAFNLNGCNTRVTLKIKDSCKTHSGQKFIHYNRYKITDVFRGFKLPAYNGYFETVHILLDFLNQAWNLPLLKEEFIDQALATSAVFLAPKDDSIYFIPGHNISLSYFN